MATQKAKKRTPQRSSAGKKLYAERDKKGKFEDVQSYKRDTYDGLHYTREANRAMGRALSGVASHSTIRPASLSKDDYMKVYRDRLEDFRQRNDIIAAP